MNFSSILSYAPSPPLLLLNQTRVTRPDPTCLAFSSVWLTRYSSVGSLRRSWCVLLCCGVRCCVVLCSVVFCCFVVLLFCCFVVLMFCCVLLCCVVLFLVLPVVPVSHIARNTNCNCWVAQWCRGSMYVGDALRVLLLRLLLSLALAKRGCPSVEFHGRNRRPHRGESWELLRRP